VEFPPLPARNHVELYASRPTTQCTPGHACWPRQKERHGLRKTPGLRGPGLMLAELEPEAGPAHMSSLVRQGSSGATISNAWME